MNWRNGVKQVQEWALTKFGGGPGETQQGRELSRLIKRGGVKRAWWIVNYMENILGGYRSFENRLPVDRDGDPLPWYTYPAIEYIQQLDFSKCNVFEYGSGNSSKFWAKRALMVTSVESDLEWYQTGRASMLPNQTLLLKTEIANYAGTLAAAGDEFEVIVIDGMYRYNCAAEAVQKIKKGGLILLDNSDWYPATSYYLREKGFIQVDFIGAGPINSYAWCTSIFFRDKLVIPRKNEQDAPVVQAGLVQISEHDRWL